MGSRRLRSALRQQEGLDVEEEIGREVVAAALRIGGDTTTEVLRAINAAVREATAGYRGVEKLPVMRSTISEILEGRAR